MSLRIRNWKDHFENNRTRELKTMAWVPVPNRMDDLGYIRLVTHPNGAAHLGAWKKPFMVRMPWRFYGPNCPI